MSSTIQRYAPPANGRGPVSQSTSIEQSRAIADVQAAVTVAQNCPRDMAEAEAEMVYVCGRLSVAEQAFYRVQNRGTGPSVHLMRELARIWGNIDYGVKELARDDTKGESEVLATCWDMQKNTRSSRTFIVPHARMAAGSRRQLDDLQDIYLNNQNIGARAVRECIETVLPKWFTERAQEVCRQTLANGEGEPLSERIQASIAWFRDRLGVTLAQLETSVGRERGKWTADDLAQLKISGKSITAGEVGRDEVFPPIVADTVEACDTDPAAESEKPPIESKLAGKVKAAKPAAAQPEATQLRTEETGSGAATEPEKQEQVEADSDTDGGAGPAQEKPPTGDRIYREPETEDAPEPPADPEPAPEAKPAPGAPTADTPGQTDRVASALNKANKAGAQRAMADMIETALAKVNVTDPADIRAVASHILGVEVGESTQLDLKPLKQVQDTVFAWRDLGTLDQMATDAINSADQRNNNN